MVEASREAGNFVWFARMCLITTEKEVDKKL
jgi:hypothetical protein